MSSLNLNRRDVICFTTATAALGLLAPPRSVAAQTASTPGQPASLSTIEFNKNSTASLPWSDKTDFANAKRGLIARLPDDGVIRDKDGKNVWDLSRFTGFIKDDAAAPDTVNPSLWRMAQLLMEAGLYEVVPGVYQVRGVDLSNLTIVEGEQGITIYDPLISAETARAALDLSTRTGQGNRWWPSFIPTLTSITREASAALWTKPT